MNDAVFVQLQKEMDGQSALTEGASKAPTGAHPPRFLQHITVDITARDSLDSVATLSRAGAKAARNSTV